MKSGSPLTFAAFLLLLAGGACGAAAQQPRHGCLAAGNCGTKGNTPAAVSRDYWQNWVCTECHTGPSSGFMPSPQERALVAVPSRFWVMHAQAERNGETRARMLQRRGLKPLARMAPVFQRLMRARPQQGR